MSGTPQENGESDCHNILRTCTEEPESMPSYMVTGETHSVLRGTLPSERKAGKIN